jgi:hypothetical protein
MEGGCAPRFLKRCRLSTARVLIIQGDTERQELPINQFNAGILVPELRAACPAADPHRLQDRPLRSKRIK